MYFKYLKYVLRHKWFVLIECSKRGYFWRGLIHDLSKFRPSEFIPYARYFYGNWPKRRTVSPGEKYFYHVLCKEDVNQQFDKAWLLHIHRNPHHWQFWLLQEDSGSVKLLPVPRKYLIEMGCDWIGAGKAITGKDNLKTWYIQNKEKIQLNELSKQFIEKYFLNLK